LLRKGDGNPVVEDVVAELMRDLPEAVRENDIEDG
jgi:hypothetical protein